MYEQLNELIKYKRLNEKEKKAQSEKLDDTLNQIQQDYRLQLGDMESKLSSILEIRRLEAEERMNKLENNLIEKAETLTKQVDTFQSEV